MSVFMLMTSCRSDKEHSPTEDGLPGSLNLSDAQIQLANINIADVRAGSIFRNITLPASIKLNEGSKVIVSTWIPGRIEKLYFKNTGEIVKKGDRLYDFYSEELINAQREYIRLQSNNWNFSASYEPRLAAEERLLIMGLQQWQISQLARDGQILFTIPVYSTVSSRISSVFVTEGQFLEQGETLFQFADDNELWVEAQVYPGDAGLIKPGMPATVTIPAAGDLSVDCKIRFVKPSIETGRNVSIVRAVIENNDKRLYPGMMALLNINVDRHNGLIIPASAVLSGKNEKRIWVREENGSFTYRNVTTGIETRDSVLILSGISMSDKVVTTGAYLLNSELIMKYGYEQPRYEKIKDMMAGNGHK